MKKLSILFISLLLVGACQTKTDTNLKQLIVKKKAIEKQIDSLSSKLIDLDKAIAKLDTTQKLQLVTSLKLKASTFKHFLTLQGFVGTNKNSIIRPEVSGTVTAVLVKETQIVKQGDPLIKIDDSLVIDNINEIKTQIALAETTFNRQARLWSQKIGSEIQYLQAKTNKESLEKKLKTLETQLEKTTIKAPFSGTIDDIIPNVGEFVSPLIPVIRLVNLEQVYVEADISENYIGKIKRGNQAQVYFENLDKTFNTKISQVADFIDPNNRSFKIKIFLKNDDNSLKPNLIADIKINDYTANNAITIPSYMVQEDQNGNNFVYTLKKENKAFKAIKTIITKGLSYEDKTHIISGLSLKSIVVDKGARGIKNGQLVNVVKL